MSAPSGTQWGAISGSGNVQGRIGINVTLSSTDTQTKATIEIWYWTRYAVQDSSNTFKYGWASSPNVTIGAKSINHTVNSTSWSTSNQTKIGTYTKTFSRGTADSTQNASASFSTIEYGGGSGSVAITFKIPKRASYILSYDANGGTGAPDRQTWFYGTDIIISKSRPTRSGYLFIGWSTDENDTSAEYFPGGKWSGTNKGNVTLYAVWERIKHTVTFNPSATGGTMSDGSDSYTVYVAHGDEVGILPTAERTNYRFVGWSRNLDPDMLISSKTVITEDITFYAIFELQANCYIKKDNKQALGMMYQKSSGAQKTGEIYVKRNGKYVKYNM